MDPVDLGGLISWTPPAALRRVQLYRVDLASSGAGALQSDERVQIGGAWGGLGGKLFRGDEGVEFLEDFKGGVLYKFMIDLWKSKMVSWGFLRGWKRQD